jgi:hypothetical protein
MTPPNGPALPPGDSLYGSPTAVELLEAVESFLRLETGDLPPLAAFHERVAANVVQMVARELAAGDNPRRSMAIAYEPLGAHDEESLATAVRSGELDNRTEELRSALELVVRSRLEVANPRYLESNPHDEPPRHLRA